MNPFWGAWICEDPWCIVVHDGGSVNVECRTGLPDCLPAFLVLAFGNEVMQAERPRRAPVQLVHSCSVLLHQHEIAEEPQFIPPFVLKHMLRQVALSHLVQDV